MNTTGVVVVHAGLDDHFLRRTTSTIKGSYYLTESSDDSPCSTVNSKVRYIAPDRGAGGCSHVIILIDGARMLSPGVIPLMERAFKAFDDPFVYTVGMHIGSKHQSLLAADGWTSEDEDELLDSVDWVRDGYELFKVSSPGGSGSPWGQVCESNCFGMRTDAFLRLGGYDERFVSPGGGLANLELFQRFQSQLEPVYLIGEATFHQFHGGVSSNAPPGKGPGASYREEYRALFGKEFVPKWIEPTRLGKLREAG